MSLILDIVSKYHCIALVVCREIHKQTLLLVSSQVVWTKELLITDYIDRYFQSVFTFIYVALVFYPREDGLGPGQGSHKKVENYLLRLSFITTNYGNHNGSCFYFLNIQFLQLFADQTDNVEIRIAQSRNSAIYRQLAYKFFSQIARFTRERLSC
jgi:hypothetical protein